VETLVGRHSEPPAAVNLETIEQLAVRGFVLLIGERTRIMKYSNIVVARPSSVSTGRRAGREPPLLSRPNTTSRLAPPRATKAQMGDFALVGGRGVAGP
jgi:hypothetical protein